MRYTENRSNSYCSIRFFTSPRHVSKYLNINEPLDTASHSDQHHVTMLPFKMLIFDHAELNSLLSLWIGLSHGYLLFAFLDFGLLTAEGRILKTSLSRLISPPSMLCVSMSLWKTS